MKRWIAGLICSCICAGLIGLSSCRSVTGTSDEGIATPGAFTEKEEAPQNTTGKVAGPKRAQQTVEQLVNDAIGTPPAQGGGTAEPGTPSETPAEPESPPVQEGTTEEPVTPLAEEEPEETLPAEEETPPTEETPTPEDAETIPPNGETSEPEDEEPVTLLYPAVCFNNIDMTVFDPEGYCLLNGYLSAEVLPNGSVQVTMTRARQREMLEETRQRLVRLLGNTAKGDMSLYIKSVQYTVDFNKISFFVYPDQYEALQSAVEMLNSAVYSTVVLYQALSEAPVRSEITYYDAETKAVLNQSVWEDYN